MLDGITRRGKQFAKPRAAPDPIGSAAQIQMEIRGIEFAPQATATLAQPTKRKSFVTAVPSESLQVYGRESQFGNTMKNPPLYLL